MALGTASREALLHGAWHSGAAALTRTFCTDRLVILRYHSVCDDVADPDYVSKSISVPVRAFEAQMRYLARNYCTISLDDAVACMIAGRAFPRRAVVVTFDDGYRDNYEFAFGALKQHAVPATIYLVSSTLSERRMLWTSGLRYAIAHARAKCLHLPELTPAVLRLDSDRGKAEAARGLTNLLNQIDAAERHALVDRIGRELGAPVAPAVHHWFLGREQISEMWRHGITFGAHTVTHPNLPGITLDAARDEIVRSGEELSRILGTNVTHFSYPNSGSLHPHVSDAVAEVARTAGYASAVTSHKGACRPASDRFRLRRLGINRARSPLPRFSFMLEATRLGRGSVERAVDD